MTNTKFLKFLTGGIITIMLVTAFFIGNQFKPSIANAATEGQKAGIIAVNGEGSIKVKPDIAYLSLGVQTQNSNAKVAQSENATKMNNVMTALKQLGIKEEDIQTTQYSMYPNHVYNHNTGKSTIDGYTVQNMVRVVIRNLDSVGTVIDTVSKNDSNLINSIEFGISNTSKYYLEALSKATTDAKGKADAIAKTISVSISKPSKVIESGQSSPIIYEARVMMDKQAEATSISSGMLEVTASVTVEYTY